jgi:hypothetical protein
MLEQVDPIESFRPDPDKPCLCGKKKNFSKCCGINKLDRSPPYGIILRKNFIPSKACDNLVLYAEDKIGVDLTVRNENAQKKDSFYKEVNQTQRVTTKVNLGEKQSIINKWTEDIYFKFLKNKIKHSIRSFEEPQLMRYVPGGFYIPHSDSDIFDQKEKRWKKIEDRDYSMLLYLNDDFEGGSLRFEFFNFTYQPRKGDLLIFPSNYLYLHEARKVERGHRYVIVSWMNVK